VTRAPESEVDPLIGRVLGGRYRIDTLLGSGSVGRVYAAEHVLMRKPLAVKILHAEHAKNPAIVARFEREATAAANIDHANVVAAMDFGRLDDGSVYLALELVQGRNLRAEMARGPFGVRRALHVARQIALGLAAAHARNIVHRDLKPENIVLVEKDGDVDFVKVLDFGIAKLTDEGNKDALTKVGMVLGTMDYMAPEQALGKRVDGRADLYALGVVTYEMLCGARPYEGESAAAILQLQLTKSPPSLLERAPGLGIPPGVEARVMKLLAKEPKDRPAFAAAVAAQFAELIAAVATEGPAAPGSPVARGPARSAPRPNRPTYLPSDPLPQFTFPPVVEQSRKLAEEVQAAVAATVVAPPVVVPLSAVVPPPAVVPPVVVRPPRTRAALALDGVAAWIEDHRRFLPRIIRRPLRRVPSLMLAGVLLAVGILVMLLIVAWLT
jgi:eukaryotic-like serine/threonine-protein kinase